MEAFILTDKVIAKEHMTRQSLRPKYLKKYEIPSQTSTQTKIRPVVARKVLTPLMSVNAPRTKQLLTELLQSKPEILNQSSSEKIEKYFIFSSQPSRQSNKKSKVGLLTKTIEPQSQHYDADFGQVNKRAPCWGFLPERRQPIQPDNIENEKPIRKTESVKHKKRPSKPKPFEFGQFLEKEEQKLSVELKGRNQVDSRLQYSTSELGKCTINIFKKYKLDKDSYFKRMLAGMQQL